MPITPMIEAIWVVISPAMTKIAGAAPKCSRKLWSSVLPVTIVALLIATNMM